MPGSWNCFLLTCVDLFGLRMDLLSILPFLHFYHYTRYYTLPRTLLGSQNLDQMRVGGLIFHKPQAFFSPVVIYVSGKMGRLIWILDGYEKQEWCVGVSQASYQETESSPGLCSDA